MSTPSSAKLPPGSSSKIVRGSKRNATGRSRVMGASSVSNSSRRVNGSMAGGAGGASGHGSGHPTRVFLEGVDVTPQSLLLSRVKPSTPSGAHDHRGKGRGGKGSRSKVSHAHGVGGASVMGASALFSTASTSSADNDSDNESSAAVTGPTGGHGAHGTTAASSGAGRGAHKDVKPGGIQHHAPLAAAPVAASNQEDEEGESAAIAGDPEEPVDGKVDNDDLQQEGNSGAGLDRDMGLQSNGKPSAGAAAVAAHARRAPVTVLLAETATEVLLELRSVCVAQDAPNHAAVGARNKRYQVVCAQKKGSDKFVEGRTQTLQLAQKAKEVMTAPPATRDAACVATDWDIYDCARLEDESNAEPEDLGASVGLPTPAADAQASTEASTETQGSDATTEDTTTDAADRTAAAPGPEGIATGGNTVGSEFGDVYLKRQVDEIVGATLASPGCMLDVDGDIVEDLRARQHHVTRSHRKGRGHHGGTGHSGNAYSQKSRVLDGQRSTANAMLTSGHSGNSNASQALGDGQSSGNVSFGASQDFVGLAGGDGASSGSAANSQAGIGMSSASHGVLSGGGGVTSGDGRHNNVYARANTNVDIGEIIAHQRTAHVLGSASLLLTASIVERAVQQNVYHSQHVRYRDLPTLSGVSDDESGHGSEVTGVVVPALNTNFSAMGATARSDASGASTGSSKTSLHLEELWPFRCDLTQGRTVSCLAWNTANDDLLAVSYAREEPSASVNPTVGSSVVASGPHASGGAGSPGMRPGHSTQAVAAAAATAATANSAVAAGNDGLVLFWSLTNPEFPERIYHLDVGVTSVAFSTAHPYLLAVGFADGVVAIYDTRKDDATPVPSAGAPAPLPAAVTTAGTATIATPPKRVPVPIATSAGSTGKHLDAVWQVRWVARGGGESVVSVSGDGRVVEWSLKKGLSFSDLMTLKRAPNPLLGGAGTAAIAASGGPGGAGAAGASGGGDGVISRQASGRCLAFASRGDPSVYFVGTEDGLVHKCSVSYNEQYLQTYVGHTGPVYQLLVSPFCSDLFLSCSGDWSLKLWQQADPKGDAALTFRSVDLTQAVLDASWSPSNAAVFAAVAEDGRVELWDLAQSILDPVVRHFPKKYISVPCATATGTGGNATANPSAEVGASARDGGADTGANAMADPSDEVEEDADASAPAATAATATPATSGPAATTSVVVALECTTVAFAPTAPVLVVGDSTGDVTVYRVPAQLSGVGSNGGGSTSADAVGAGVEEQAARLLRAIHPNKHD